MNFSNSTTNKTEKLKDTKSLAFQWETIDWKQVEYDVNRLQTRIAKATVKGHNNKAKRLQYLLTHSFSTKAYAVRKVTTNKEKNTSGVDKKLWSTSASKMKAVLSLTNKNYKAKPLRRVYIEKKCKKQKRPLGIPTMYDRAMQTLYALALEPIAETKGDSISFGFRRGRSAKDACEQIFCVLARKCSPTWILEGDIKGCFDNINHEWLQNNIPMDKRIMKQFLKSGYVYKEKLFPTKSSIKNIIRRCSAIILKEGKASTQSDLIRRLNQILRGWTNYHKHVVASKAFSNINNTLYHLLQQWAKHRHPNKNKWWRLNKYWHEKAWKRWLFKTDKYSLINLRRIKIIRHPKLQIKKTPFLDKDYFDKRKIKLHTLVAARKG